MDESYGTRVARILAKRFTAMAVAGKIEIHARVTGGNALMCGAVVRDQVEMPFHAQLTCERCRVLWEAEYGHLFRDAAPEADGATGGVDE